MIPTWKDALIITILAIALAVGVMFNETRLECRSVSSPASNGTETQCFVCEVRQ